MITFLLLLSTLNAQSMVDCTKTAREYVPFPNFKGELNPPPLRDCWGVPDQQLKACNQDWEDSHFLRGSYMRVDPSGEYLLLTYSRKAVLVHLTRDAKGQRKAVPIRTNLKKETYGVGTEQGWKLLISPDPERVRPMEYHLVEDVLKNPMASKPIHTDRKFNDFYHSAGLLPGSTENSLKLRVVIGDPLSMRDITFNRAKSGKVKTEPGKIYRLCANLSGYSRFDQPNISRNGLELFIGTDGPKQEAHSSHVAKILDDKGNCGTPERIGFGTSKMSDSVPDGIHKGKLTFTSSVYQPIDGPPSERLYQGVIVHDRDTGKTYKISPPGEDGSYPGFTRDGRIIYYVLKPHGDQMRGGVVITQPDVLQSCGSDQSETIH